jgi:hypothetical protein
MTALRAELELISQDVDSIANKMTELDAVMTKFEESDGKVATHLSEFNLLLSRTQAAADRIVKTIARMDDVKTSHLMLK